MSRPWLCAAACFGALGVILGAFGAHGIEPWLAEAPEGARRLAWWRTASSYHLWHALALGLAALAAGTESRRASLARWAFATGIVLFSGSLYTMTLTHMKGLGAVTPLGGLALIVGWFALAATALERSASEG